MAKTKDLRSPAERMTDKVHDWLQDRGAPMNRAIHDWLGHHNKGIFRKVVLHIHPEDLWKGEPCAEFKLSVDGREMRPVLAIGYNKTRGMSMWVLINTEQHVFPDYVSTSFDFQSMDAANMVMVHCWLQQCSAQLLLWEEIGRHL